MNKLCYKCKVEKLVINFSKSQGRKPDDLHNWCKECVNIYNKQYRLANKIAIAEKDKIRKKKIRDIDPELLRVYSRNSYKKHRKKKIRKEIEKSKTDLIYNLRLKLRQRLNKALKNNYKIGSAIKDLGCSIQEFKLYIESKFKIGMSWENYGKGIDKWNLDHIKPLSLFNLQDTEEFKKANHYTNIQPLWAVENYSKGKKWQIN